MKNNKFYLICVVFFLSINFQVCSQNSYDDDFPLITITAGKIAAFNPGKRSNIFGIEYRGKNFSKWNLIPTVGYLRNSHYIQFLHLDLKHDWQLNKKIVFTLGLGTGVFDSNDNIDLGNPIEFKSSFELTYRFKKGIRLGIEAYHISNSKLSNINPGTESIVLSFSLPLGSVFK
jgi:hypothetical protein